MIEEKKHSEYAGYVYVLSNPSMPGMVKIGRSKHGGRTRARDIYKQGGTGVPTPFFMEFELWTDDCIALESLVHEELSNDRVSEFREFFMVDVHKAIEAVMRAYGYDHMLVVQEADTCISEDQIIDMLGNSKEVRDFAADISPTPLAMTIANAISQEITPEQIIETLNAYSKSCEKRRLAIEAKREQVKTELKAVV